MRRKLIYFIFVLLLTIQFVGTDSVLAESSSSSYEDWKREMKEVKQSGLSKVDEEKLEKGKKKLGEIFKNDATSIKTLDSYWEEEPNNTLDDANVIELEDIISGDFSYNDIDIYQFDVNNPIELMIAGVSDSSVGLDFILADENGYAMEPIERGFHEGVKYLYYTIYPGSYYIGAVDTYGGGSGGMYSLSAYQLEYIERIAGENRYDTAIEMARLRWPLGTDNVVLSTGLNFPDALAGAPLAFQMDAPILLTPRDRLHSSVKDLLVDFGVKHVTILGGDAAVSGKVEMELKENMGLDVRRLSGKNRYETAVAISNNPLPNHQAIVVDGGNFPDALSIAPYSAMYGHPILLTDSDNLPKATKEVLSNFTKTIVIGGNKAVSEKVAHQLPSPHRISGKNRYDTSATIARELNMPTQHVVLATGEGFADALTGSSLSASLGVPTILTQKDRLHDSTERFLKEENTSYYTILGGYGAIGVGVEDDILGIE